MSPLSPPGARNLLALIYFPPMEKAAATEGMSTLLHRKIPHMALNDIASAPTNVRYRGQSGHRNSERSGLLLTDFVAKVEN